MYLETQILPNPAQQEVIDFIFGLKFAWYRSQTTNDFMMYSHVLMDRPDREIKTNAVRGTINSDVYQYVEPIFLDICKANNVEVNTIFRANVNSTSHHNLKHGDIHDDHDFPHKQFIWYLNDFTDGPTYLFDENDKLEKTTAVGKNKIAIFSGQRHAQGFCAPNEDRVVMVFTFN